MTKARSFVMGIVGLAAALQLAGCPGQGPYEYVAGGTGDQARLGDEPSVDVLSPITDLSVTGGTPVEVNWFVVATTNFAAIDVIFDLDESPDNDNEIVGLRNIPFTETTALLDTTELEADTYFVGVVLRERNEIAAYGYAPGRLIVNQRSDLVWDSPKDNFVFDRTQRVTPRFDVAWRLYDPDSTVTTQILLDPDDIPDGDEFLLRESNSQTGDSFSFNLPTALFEPGIYRILALVSDGVDTAEFYAPATIRLRARLAGNIDLRDLHLPESELAGGVFEGFNPRDNLGSFVDSLRDIDGDGFGDFIMLSQFAKPVYESNLQRTGVGEAYLVYGRANRFSGVISVNSTGTLFRGEIYRGPREVEDPIRPSRGIRSFTVLSDWDNDSIREFAFGIPFTDSQGAADVLDPPGYFRTGAVVVAAGSTLRPDLGFPGGQVIDLDMIGTRRHVGLNEITPLPPEGFVGPKASLLIGGGGFTSFHWHLVDIEANPIGGYRLGCRLSTNEPYDQCGETVSTGDFDSIIISVPNRDPGIATLFNYSRGINIPGAGVVSVYFVRKGQGFYPWWEDNAPPANADLNYPGVAAPSDKARLPHGGPYHYIFDDFRFFQGPGGPWRGSPGYIVDEDDDGVPPLVYHWGAPWATVAGVSGRTTRFWGEMEGGNLGNAVGIDDFNGDGLRDILIGYPQSKDGAGACFIVLNRLRGLVEGGELQIEELGLPMNSSDDPAGVRIFDGIRVVGSPGERLGQAQDNAGDFNGDGFPDVVIGSPFLNNRCGGVAVFFGSRDVINLTEEEIPLQELPTRVLGGGPLGVVFVGETEGDLAGARVTGVGDADGDGNDDILVAAPNRSVRLDIDLDGTLEIDRTDCGVVYLVYGSPDLRGVLELADVGTEKLPGAVFIGRSSGDFLGGGLGEQGDRSVGIGSAGDVDGDGNQDLLMSSVSASPRDRVRAGEVYLIYGQGGQ
jgi:hypothetical protein